MLSVVCWRWGQKFGPQHVNTLRSMLQRHLHIPHKLYCVTAEPEGIDGDVHIVEPPVEFSDTVRCRRRMVQYAEWFSYHVGYRMLALDLDVVLTDDVTPLFDRPEPVVLWKVGYAQVYSGSVQLFDTGFLDGLYQWYQRDPEGLPLRAAPRGTGSDQAMLNYYLACREFYPPEWTEADGIYTFFGKGYEKKAHLGVGPLSAVLPDGCRMVVLGSDDLAYLSLPIFQEHYR